MNPTLRYVLIGVASMASAEFQANVLLRGNLIHFVMAMGMYAVLSLIACQIGKHIRSELAFYVGGGLFGLLIIEWWLIGFYPGSGKAGVHVAMFTNWGVVFSLPRLFQSELADASLRQKVKRTVWIYSLLAPVLVLLLPIPRGGSVAILMTFYSIRLTFQFIPFLAPEAGTAKRLRIALWIGVVLAVVNILTW